MKNFLNVGVLFVVGAMPAVSVASFLRQMLCLLTVRLSGGKVLYFKYLCLDYRQENGEGKMRMGQFSPVCQFLYTNGDRVSYWNLSVASGCFSISCVTMERT